MRFHFVVNRRVPARPSPVVLEVYDLLTRAGHEVTDGITEEALVRPDLLRPDADLYVVKSHTELAFSLAGALDAAGARQLNPYASWAATQDKFVAARYPACGRDPDTAIVAHGGSLAPRPPGRGATPSS